MSECYIIGDIHGCFETFERLLQRIEFGPTDELWSVGDLINRGPDSLSVLEWFVEHSDQVEVVLGNHDLHFMAVASGVHEAREEDTFDNILTSSRLDEFVDWYRNRNLVYRAENATMVHAGIWPSWNLDKLEVLAGEVEQKLRDEPLEEVFEDMYGNEPTSWSDELAGIDRLRFIVNACTRMRTLDDERRMCFDYSGPYDNIPGRQKAWFDIPAQKLDSEVYFGHWSALGYTETDRGTCVDSACVWGGKLTALRVSDGRRFSVESEMPKVFG